MILPGPVVPSGLRAAVRRSLLVAIPAALSLSTVAGLPGEVGAQRTEAGALPTESVFDVRAVEPGVWAAVVRPEPHAYAFANSLVVRIDGELLVVDTQQSPASARALIRWIREGPGLPVGTVVNTHWHGDHVYGNAAYRDAFPGVVFVGHEATARVVERDGRGWIADELEGIPGTIEAREEWLRSGTGPDGEALDRADRASLERSVRLRRAYLAELEALELVPPGRTFADELTLAGTARRVVLRHLGPAHTDGDIVVYLPGERVLAAGDLVETGLPYLVEESSLVGWAGALERLAELEVEHLLPAHGPLLDGDGLLRAQRDLFADLVDGVRKSLDAGLAPDRVPSTIDLSHHRERLSRWGDVTPEALREWTDDAASRVAGELSRAELLDADRSFARATAREGIDGWVRFFAGDGAMIQPGVGEIRGRDEIRSAMEGLLSDPAVTFSWEPVRGEVAGSGDVGWTTGTYELRRGGGADGPSTTRGRYVSIWRRGGDGAWRVVMDIGNPVGER